ncbi:TRL-like family protein [Bacterioplanoides sp.]|uniref:TRL-like family protein n=1 Tax=Bacterioplanoides sp. TaxID=2066072 RepID=UPI003B5A4D9C
MKLILKAAAISGIALLATGCSLAPTPAGNGLLYTNVQYQGMANNDATAQKTGSACATNILGLFATGDASIEAAKKAGGITKVATVDAEVTSVMLFFSKYCTVVSGN